MSLDIGPGDLVLTTPYTFFATMGTILARWGKTAFLSMSTPKSLNMDPVLGCRSPQEADRARRMPDQSDDSSASLRPVR